MTGRGHSTQWSQRRPEQGWFIRAHGEGFLNAQVTKLSDRAHRVFQVLDCRAGRDPFCYPGNKWICERTGKKEATLREIYAELEEGGWLRRVYTDSTKKERVGFIFLRRVDPESPVAEDTCEGIERANAAMIAAIEGRASTIPRARLANAGEEGSQAAGNPASRGDQPPETQRLSRRESSVTSRRKSGGVFRIYF